MSFHRTSLRAGSTCIQHRASSGRSCFASRDTLRSEGLLRGRRVLIRRRRQSPGIRVARTGLGVGRVHGAELRAAGLDRDHRVHELWPLLGHLESHAAALRVREHDDRRADPIEQRDSRRHGHVRALAGKLHLRANERVEDGISRLPRSGPLRVVVPSREVTQLAARGPDPCELEPRANAEVAVDPLAVSRLERHVGRAAARRVVHHVDHVARIHQRIDPALATVGRIEPVLRRLTVAVEDHHRVRRLDLLRHPDFRVHGAVHDLLARLADI